MSNPICVWCGKEMILKEYDRNEGRKGKRNFEYQYCCDNWNKCPVQPETLWHDSPEEAAESWDKRVTDKVVDNEELIKACEHFVWKCENGKARSKESYTQMKEALSKIQNEEK